MIKQIFRCNTCQKSFRNPKIYYEKHGLATVPYEAVAVCPHCNSDDFIIFDEVIEKIEVAERLLHAVSAFNRYYSNIKDIFGIACENCDFDEGYSILTEFINEIFSFIPVSTEREIFKMHTTNDVKRILLYLKG